MTLGYIVLMLSFILTYMLLALIENRVVKTQKTSWKIVLVLVSTVLAIAWGGLGYALLSLGQTYSERYSGQNLLNLALGWMFIITGIVILLSALRRIVENKLYKLLVGERK